MPTKYKITDKKTGRTLVVSGNRPPTSKDAREIFSQHFEDLKEKNEDAVSNIEEGLPELADKMRADDHEKVINQFVADHPMLDHAVGGMKGFLQRNPTVGSALMGAASYGEGFLVDNVKSIIKGNIPETPDEAIMAPVLPMYKQAKQFLQSASSQGIGEATKEQIPFVGPATTAFSTDPNLDVNQRLRAAGQFGGQVAIAKGMESLTPKTPPTKQVMPEIIPPEKGLPPITIDVTPTESNLPPHTPPQLEAGGDNLLPQYIKTDLKPTEEFTPEPQPKLPKEVPKLKGKKGTIPEIDMQKAGDVTYPKVTKPPEDVTAIPTSTKGKFNLPGKVAPVQVIKFNPSTGEVTFSDGKSTTLDKGTRMEIQEHQKLSGESDSKLAAQDVINSKQRPLANLTDADLKTLHELSPTSETANELAQRSTSVQKSPTEELSAPSGPIKENIIPDVESPETIQLDSLTEQAHRNLTKNLSPEDKLNLAFSEDYPVQLQLEKQRLQDIESPEELNKFEEVYPDKNRIFTNKGELPEVKSPELVSELPEGLRTVDDEIKDNFYKDFSNDELIKARDRSVNIPTQLEWELKNRNLPLKPNKVIDIPKVETPEEFQARGGKINKLPPDKIPNEPLEFGKPVEELSNKIRKAKEKSDSILKRLLSEEEGTFEPGKIIDWFKGLSHDDEFKNYVSELQYKIASGQKLSPTEIENLKGSQLGEAVFNYADKSGKLNKLAASMGSAEQNLSENPWTKPVADILKGTIKGKPTGEIPKEIWRAEVYSAIDKIRGKFLTPSQKEQVGQILDNYEQVPLNIKGASPKVTDIADGYRHLLDAIWEFGKSRDVKTFAGNRPGTIKEYFTHIQNDPTIPEEIKMSVAAIFDDVARGEFKKLVRARLNELSGTTDIPLSGKVVGDKVYVQPKPTPTSGYVERRTGEIKDIEYNSDRVMRAYINSMARVIFDKPAVIDAREALSKVPDSTLKRNGTWLIRDYAGYDALDLSNDLRNAVNYVTKVGSRSVLALNPAIQTLHLGRALGQVVPESLAHGPVPAIKGLVSFVKNPLQAIKDARDAGMLPQSQVPFAMKRPMEKLDAISNFMDAGNSIAKAYALRVGHEIYPDNPKLAIDWAMKAEGAVSDSRRVEAFEQSFSKIAFNFKYWLQKYGELNVRAFMNTIDKPTLNNLMRTAAYPAALYGLYKLTEELGVRFAHLGITSLELGNVALTSVGRIVNDLSKGKFEAAFTELAKFLIPGGHSIPRLLKNITGTEQSDLPIIQVPN